MKKNISDFIPVNEPIFYDKEIEYVTECIKTGWVSSSGGFVKEFEDKWAGYCGREFGISVSSGTAALQLAVSSLELSPGDEVIIPTFTIISCALAVIQSGAVPVLVDSDPDTWTMDVNQINNKLTKRTKAIMLVHMYGHPVDVDPILELAEKHGLKIIEDAAQAHGVEYYSEHGSQKVGWNKCGSFGHLSCFSFYANKVVTTGEGGMIVTDDKQLAQKLRSLRNLCFKDNKRYYHEQLGYNFRFTNLQAALGLAQLERIDEIVEKKHWIGVEYTKRLNNLENIKLQVNQKWARTNYWMFGLLVDEESGFTGESLSKKLLEYGIDTRAFFIGMHNQPVFNKMNLFINEDYPVSDYLSMQGLYLPSGLALIGDQLNYVCEKLENILC